MNLSQFVQTLAITINPPGLLTTGPATVGEVLNNVFRVLTYAVGAVGVVSIVYAGFQYITSVGNPQKTKKALFSIIYTAIGFTIAIMAQSITTFIYSKVQGRYAVQAVISEGINTFLWATGIAAVIVIIIAGILYAISMGEPAKTKAAKDTILYAAVGLVVALVAGAGITALNSFIGGGSL